MKQFAKIFSVVLALTLLFSLAGCSSFGKIRKAFEKNDYTLNEDLESVTDSLYKAAMDEETMNEMGITIKVHAFQKNGTLLNWVIILEFDCSKEKMQEYMESETVKGAFKDAQNSDYVNGSCVFLAGDKDALEIFKKA